MERTYLKRFLNVCYLITCIMILVYLCGGVVSADPVPVFEMKDPEGDDYGPGTYVYPTHKTFLPGLFDLTYFRVSHDVEYVYFDLTFREITNPWNAPEGFSHQLINIYIDTTKGAGRTDALNKGAMVAFDNRYAWDIYIKALGWGGCRVFTSQDDKESQGISDGIEAGVLLDGKTIRVKVPLAIVGQPDPAWGYYVLIGSQDAFGEDDFRPVMKDPGPWTFGGGTNLDFNPNVIDILAPEGGKSSQERQLGSYDADKGTLAVLVPVSGKTVRSGIAFLGFPSVAGRGTSLIIGGVLLAGIGILVWLRRRGIIMPPKE
ncbi:MAG: hypothetical protein GX969_03365 [Firmicutes bacterium]|jgi:carbohydrate-binding DOMON domain-containing protein|nr:hypothetical protein [Bacillota bacterium]